MSRGFDLGQSNPADISGQMRHASARVISLRGRAPGPLGVPSAACGPTATASNNLSIQKSKALATKKNPEQGTHSGFSGKFVASNIRLLTGRWGVGGWGPPSRPNSVTDKNTVPRMQVTAQ